VGEFDSDLPTIAKKSINQSEKNHVSMPQKKDKMPPAVLKDFNTNLFKLIFIYILAV